VQKVYGDALVLDHPGGYCEVLLLAGVEEGGVELAKCCESVSGVV
jgi:hypothetical protein